ncbi:MAG: DUF3732 domain-containing protein [Hyphomicrobiaceae bacterium]|nr:MAG: DUF3732 domain-containing protein [Hyphomicrobiaceae bacterium]
MKLDVLELILWSRGAHPPRRVAFKPGKVNVITGDSKTGKSAIVPIIDYCLGAHHCAIPTRTIRDTCAWFGLVIATVDGLKLLARREPGGQQSTDVMYVLEGDALKVDKDGKAIIPDRIDTPNFTAGQVRSLLNRLAGISNLDLEPDSKAIEARRPSIRDFIAFVFQPQNVVANPDVFFFKADTTEHREKLKAVFPYALGAIDAQTLLDRARLDRLSKELARKERELANIQTVSARWQGEARSWLDHARELGLIPKEQADPRDWPTLVDLLRQLAARSFNDARPDAARIDEALSQKLALIDEERKVASEVFELRQRFNELKALSETSVAHEGALRVQKDRLALSTWLKELSSSDSPNPLIDPRLSPSQELDTLCEALACIEAEAARRPASTDVIDKEITRVSNLLAAKVEELQGVRIRLQRQTAVQPAEEASYSVAAIERFLGRLENALLTYDTVGADSDLAAVIERLRGEVAELTQRVSESDIKRRTRNALQIVQTIATEIVPNLDCEFESAPIELSIDDLSIRVVGPDRKDWLWEIGSGANWLSYHIAVTAALQRYFMRTPSHPVPHLLVYDQPSQVYFPRRLAEEGRTRGEERESSEPIEEKLLDKDIEAVRKVFTVLSNEVNLAKGRLQVIVLDHAAEEVWGGVEKVHLVEHWRAGKKLVPLEWTLPFTQ